MVPPKVFTAHFEAIHSILAVANLLAHNNISQICYCGQISLQSAAVNCSFSDTFGSNIYFAGDVTSVCYLGQTNTQDNQELLYNIQN